jgi:hypothetical protein
MARESTRGGEEGIIREVDVIVRFGVVSQVRRGPGLIGALLQLGVVVGLQLREKIIVVEECLHVGSVGVGRP